MKKFALSSLMAIFAFICVGCQSTNVSQPTSPVSSVIEANLKADIAVGGDIEGTSSATVILGLFKIGADSTFADGVTYTMGGQATASPLAALDAVAPIKAAAAYKACANSGADVLVAPRYKVVVDDFFVFKTVTVTVKGKKGTLGSIK